MILFIDAYNVLKILFDAVSITQETRDEFIGLVQFYAQRQNITTYIVFDGGPYNKPAFCRRKKYTVVYAGRNQSADDVIILLAQQYKNETGVLVTFDRQLCRRCNEYGASYMDPDIFYARMVQLWKQESIVHNKKNNSQCYAVKLTESTDSYVDTLMQEGSSHILYKKEDMIASQDIHMSYEHRGQTAKKNKKSKKERRLAPVVKKL